MSSSMEYLSSSPRSVSPTGADTSGPSSRRTSLSSTGRPSSSRRSASTGSSRSTSFNLPSEAKAEIRAVQGNPGEEVEMEEEMDEEGVLFLSFSMREMDLYAWTAAAKHAAFVRARGRHYSNEAEAMKVSSRSQVFGVYSTDNT